jgi:hypothetical protein
MVQEPGQLQLQDLLVNPAFGSCRMTSLKNAKEREVNAAIGHAPG